MKRAREDWRIFSQLSIPKLLQEHSLAINAAVRCGTRNVFLFPCSKLSRYTTAALVAITSASTNPRYRYIVTAATSWISPDVKHLQWCNGVAFRRGGRGCGIEFHRAQILIATNNIATTCGLSICWLLVRRARELRSQHSLTVSAGFLETGRHNSKCETLLSNPLEIGTKF